MAATPDPASQSRVYAPVSAASADGFTRSMCAMALFNAAKEEYAKVDPTAPDANEQRTACHRKHAKEALQFAIDNGGVYIKAAQFVASLQGGAGASARKRSRGALTRDFYGDARDTSHLAPAARAHVAVVTAALARNGSALRRLVGLELGLRAMPRLEWHRFVAAEREPALVARVEAAAAAAGGSWL